MTILQEQLDRITAHTRELVQAERLEFIERAIVELHASGAEDRILPAGARAPEFSLPDASNRPVRSADLLALGPLVINFFRGRWCAYCVTELEAWRELYEAVRARGGLVVGISPQTAHHNELTALQHGIPFPLLADAGCRTAEQYGLVYAIPAGQRRYYRSILVNIPYMNGDAGWRLPLPGTYAIAPDGRLLFARAYADFRVRPEPEEVLAALG